MSHSIRIVKLYPNKKVNLSVNFSAGQVYKIIYLYASLNTENLCNFSSGNGEIKTYTKKDIEAAIETVIKIHKTKNLNTYKTKFKIPLKEFKEPIIKKLESGLTTVDNPPDNRSISFKSIYLFFKKLSSINFEKVAIQFG